MPSRRIVGDKRVFSPQPHAHEPHPVSLRSSGHRSSDAKTSKQRTTPLRRMGAFDAAVSRNAAAADRSERPSPEKPLANGGRRKFADVSAEITQGKLPKRPRTCSAAGLISAAPHDLPILRAGKLGQADRAFLARAHGLPRRAPAAHVVAIGLVEQQQIGDKKGDKWARS